MKIDIKITELDKENYNSIKPNDKYIKLQLDKFADNVDSQIQTRLMTDLMIKYSDLSKSFEVKNQELLEHQEILKKYNTRLQVLVDDKVKEISDSQIATIFALVKLAESRDDDTGAHVERTAVLSRMMARYLREVPKYANIIDDKYIDDIYKASPLHDIGKVGIPDYILLKNGKLTQEEFHIMKTHVEIGYETLWEVQEKYAQNSFLIMGMDIVKSHHEKWDGSGYPNGLAGEDIPLAGRIMAIIDVYDALRSKRTYKEAFSHDKSCNIIREGKGKHFDPLLVDVFLKFHTQFQIAHDIEG